MVEFLKENEDVAVYDTEVTEKIESKLNSHKIFYNTTLFPFRKVLTDKSLYIFINIPQNMPLIVLKTSELYVALFLLPVLQFQHLQRMLMDFIHRV